MKKQSAGGLFLSMFLRAAVIILGIAIVVFGVVFLVKVVKDGGKEQNKTTVSNNVLTDAEAHDDLLYNEGTTAAPAETTGDTTEAPAVSSTDKQILVLNSTEVTGLAGRWCTKLNGYGFANCTASDYSTEQTATRIIASADGVGQDLVQYFNGAAYEVGSLSDGVGEDVDPSAYDIIIIIGTADSDQ